MSKLVNLSHLKKALNRIKTYFNNKMSEATTKLSEDLTTALTPDWLTNVRNRTHYLGNLLATLDNSNRSTYLSDSYADYGFYVVVDGVSTSTKITNLTPNSEKRYSLSTSNGPNITLHVNYVPKQFVHVAFTQHADSTQHKILLYGRCQPLSDVYIPETIARKTDTKPLVELSYKELKELRDNSELIPGKQYCIVNYETTTSQKGTSAERNTFDVIVTADSTNTLNEEARVRKSSIKPITVLKTNGVPTFCRLTGTEMVVNNTTYYQWVDTINSSDIILSKTLNPSLNEEIFRLSGGQTVVKYGNVLEIIDYFKDCNLEAWKIWYCLDNDTTKFGWADTTNGKGVIYRMIDEYNNDCPYDFKNIKFKRTTVTVEDPDILNSLGGMYVGYTGDTLPAELQNTDSEVYYYTFQHSDGETDLSINIKYDKTLYCHDNIIKDRFDSSNKFKMLNNIVIYSDTFTYNNTFDNGCFSMSIYGNNDQVWENHFGQYCRENIIVSNTVWQNTFGDNLASNLISNCNVTDAHIAGSDFGIYFQYNTCLGRFSENHIFSRFKNNIIKTKQFAANDIKTAFENNIIQSDTFNYNSIDNNFQNNKINVTEVMQNKIYSTFKENVINTNTFSGNIIERSFSTNTINASILVSNIGCEFQHNTINSAILENNNRGIQFCNIGSSVKNNVFNTIRNSTVGSLFQNNNVTYVIGCNFGVGCVYNNFGDSSNSLNPWHIKHCSFGNYVQYNNFDSKEITSKENPIKNIVVQNGVQGTADNNNNITLPVNSDAEVKVAKNSKGEIKIYIPADLVE